VKILILDDDPERHQGFTRVFPEDTRTHTTRYSEVVDALQNGGPFDLVYLDHDLGCFDNEETWTDAGMYRTTDVPYTGVDVARFIVRELDVGKRPTRVIIHSWNPDGARTMLKLLQSVGISASAQPYQDPG
jgi:CheY-like chemotaxis protein